MTAYARALLAGTFRFRHLAPRYARRSADVGVVEFFIQTADQPEGAAESHPAIAYGTLARTIATTFRNGDFTTVSGTMRRSPGRRLPLTLVEANCAERLPSPIPGPLPATLNVVSVVGIVDDCRNTELHDGSFAKLLSVASETFRDGRVTKDSHPVVLAPPAFKLLPSVAIGDVVRIDGSLRFQRVGSQHLWAISCARLLHLDRAIKVHAPLAPITLMRER
jgi:hypothetical protein